MKKTLTDYPGLIAQLHPTKNGSIDPLSFSYGSKKKLWWRCLRDHEWHGEKKIRKILNDMNIDFIGQWKSYKCKHIYPLSFDFAVFCHKHMGLIEYQGKQHYEPYSFGTHRFTEFDKIKRRDDVKRQFCESNNILLLEIRKN
jgi:hypothetical protein